MQPEDRQGSVLLVQCQRSFYSTTRIQLAKSFFEEANYFNDQ